MLNNFAKLALILSVYLFSFVPEGSTQVKPRYKNYIAVFNDKSKKIITRNSNTRVLIRRHLVKMGVIPLRALPLPDTYLVKLKDRKRFKKNSNFKRYFAFFEPDYKALPHDAAYEGLPRFSAAAATVNPNDPELSSFNSWGLDPYYGTNAREGWSFTTGSENEVVAVLGGGIDLTHPDLSANIWQDPAPSAGNKKETIKGFNAYNTTVANLPVDDHGITTFAAGVIGARGNNNIGVAGINWYAKLMAGKGVKNSFYSKILPKV